MSKLRFNTKQHLVDFLSDAHEIDCITDEYDSSSNHWYTGVWKKYTDDGIKFYAVDFLNGDFSECRPKKNDEPDWYEINEIKPIERVVTVTDWEYLE